jgi:hypothetical protein
MPKPALAEIAEDALALPQGLLDLAAKIVTHHINDPMPWAETWPHHWQCIRAMGYLYACDESPLQGALFLLDEMRVLYRTILDRELPDQRMAGHLAETREILGAALARDVMNGLDDVLIRCADDFMQNVLIPLRRVTHFVSASLNTSTNHVAVFSSTVHRIGAIFGRQEYLDAAISTWDRLVADQHPDGYWEETTGGPTTDYNQVTMCCAGRMARWTKSAIYHAAAQRAAKFHRRFSYPDGCSLETIDGRVRYHPYENDMWGGFVHAESAEGRAHMRRRLFTRCRRFLPTLGASLSGEASTLMCENHQYWVAGPLGDAEVDREHYVERLQAPGAVRKHGPWFASMQGIAHFPVGYGFTIDRTSLFSLWHEETALIVNGSGELGPNPGQTFLFKIAPYICHIPQRTTLSMGSPGSPEPMAMIAEYAGGTARLQVRFDSDREVTLTAQVDAKNEYYPVLFTLQLELRAGHMVNGVMLGKDKVAWTDAQLDGRVESRRVAITFPKRGATFLWPHDPYNPYDMVNFKSPPEKYVSLLQVPIGPEGIELRFTIRSFPDRQE